MMRNKKLPSTNRRAGMVAVEVAVVAPILFLIVMGAVELCRANMIRNAVENAAYVGAREGVIPGATVADVTAEANSILDAMQLDGGAVTVTPDPLVTSATELTVVVTVPYNSNSYILPKFMQNMSLRGECKLTREIGLKLTQ